jgi:hypothetical protein
MDDITSKTAFVLWGEMDELLLISDVGDCRTDAFSCLSFYLLPAAAKWTFPAP